MKILGIETSCDETAVAIVDIKNNKVKIVSNLVSSQVKIHAKYGGIVPEVAARKHIEKMIPLLDLSFKKTGLKYQNIDQVAVVNGPGLITSLIIGVETAKTLAYALNKPLVAINHLIGHIYSNWLPEKAELSGYNSLPKYKFPVLCLLISGGHTELILMKSHDQFKKVGETQDDAAGEAFDKVAKLLKIGYPGGPIIEKLAHQGNSRLFKLPRPMLDSGDFNFSFSGLKTAVLYLVKDNPNYVLNHKADLCAAFQQAVIDVLIKKTLTAAKQFGVKTLMLCGGVAANQTLRGQFESELRARLSDVAIHMPPPPFCTDNAAMVAIAAYFHPAKTSWQKIKVNPNLDLT